MKINENILKKYLSKIPHQIDILTNNHIAEVEEKNFLTKNRDLIVGQIIDIKKYSEQKELFLVKVNIGTKILSIICSFQSHLLMHKKVIIAQKHSYLEGLKTFVKDIIIDIDSDGLLCSLKDLGINDQFLTLQEKQSIYYFPDDNNVSIGDDALKILGLQGFYLDISLTPDRVDLYSHIGFAKDLNAAMGLDNNLLDSKILTTHKTNLTIKDFKILIESDQCLEFNLKYIHDIKVQPSPLWLRNILMKSNIVPVNNLIDISNLLLIEYGIPIQFFDVDKLKSSVIKVRNAYPNEKIVISNDKEYCLNSDDLLITNDDVPIALAGISNLEHSKIDHNTKSVIMTTAYFNFKNILKTSQKLNLLTETALYHGRGIDQNLVLSALERAASLLQEIFNKEIKHQNFFLQKQIRKNPKISLTLSFIHRKTGINFLWSKIKRFLELLDYKIFLNKNDLSKKQVLKLDEVFFVVAPLRRFDVNIAEDVVSDLLRMYNYNKIDTNLNEVDIAGQRNISQNKIKFLRDLLKNIGFNEIMTYSLVNQKIFNLFSVEDINNNKIQIVNPLSKDKIILRQNLVASFLEVLSYNQKRQNFNNAFFEIGKVYLKDGEYLSLGIALSGDFFNSGWLNNNIVSSFFFLKGILEKISHLLKVNLILEKTKIYHNLHVGKQANILWNGQKIGFIGEISYNIQQEYQLQKSYLLEILLDDKILNQNNSFYYKEISKFPSVVRDLSFIIDKKYSFGLILENINKLNFSFLNKCELLDVYQDDKLLSLQQCSLTLRFTFNAFNRSLNKIEIDSVINKIIQELILKYNIKIR